MAEHFHALQLKQFIKKHIDHKVRADGRKFDQFREMLATSNAIPTAHGSSLIKLGKTSVIAGITVEPIDKDCLNDMQISSLLDVQVKIRPYATYTNKRFEGRTQETRENVQLSMHLKQALLETPIFTDKNFCLAGEEAKSIQYIFEILITDFDGNSFDACVLAAMIALKKFKAPFPLASGVNFSLPLMPLSSSFCFFLHDNKVITVADPSLDEQTLAGGILTILVEPKMEKLLLVHKQGGISIDPATLICLTKVAVNRAKELRQKIDKL